jgi:hypothetical protein
MPLSPNALKLAPHLTGAVSRGMKASQAAQAGELNRSAARVGRIDRRVERHSMESDRDR